MPTGIPQQAPGTRHQARETISNIQHLKRCKMQKQAKQNGAPRSSTCSIPSIEAKTRAKTLFSLLLAGRPQSLYRIPLGQNKLQSMDSSRGLKSTLDELRFLHFLNHFVAIGVRRLPPPRVFTHVVDVKLGLPSEQLFGYYGVCVDRCYITWSTRCHLIRYRLSCCSGHTVNKLENRNSFPSS
jgi:hypothetical protein